MSQIHLQLQKSMEHLMVGVANVSMTDTDGDNVWDFTISIPSGSYEYKFSADNWNIQENLLQ